MIAITNVLMDSISDDLPSKSTYSILFDLSSITSTFIVTLFLAYYQPEIMDTFEVKMSY